MTFRPLESLTGGLKLIVVVFLTVLQADCASAQSAPASAPVPGGGLPGAPTGLVPTALPCAFKLNFTPPDDGGSPILGYYAYDPKTPWVSSWAGSVHVLKRSPILIQGGSGTHSFVVRAVNKNGVGPFSTLSKSVTSPGTPPPATDPYWIYHEGSFNWEGDFSWPGGRTVPPAVPGAAIETDWFDESVPALSGPGCVGIVLATPGNFAPCWARRSTCLHWATSTGQLRSVLAMTNRPSRSCSRPYMMSSLRRNYLSASTAPLPRASG